MNNIIVCWTPFNAIIKPFAGWVPGTQHPVLTEKWIKDRFDIWYKNTYRSICGQTNKRFIYLISCNLLSKNITDEVFKRVVKRDKRVILFYHGTYRFNSLIKFIRKKYDAVFAVRVDSDDMYSSDVFDYLLNSFPVGSNCGYFLKGYGFKKDTNQLFEYDCCKSGPFYVVKYPKGLYRFDAIEHPYIKLMGATILKENSFIVNIHEKNYSSAIRKPYFGNEIVGVQKEKILKRFSL